MSDIVETAITRRRYWVDEIEVVSGEFGKNSERIEQEISEEIKKHGKSVVIDHLRLCGVIPEKYPHDSSAEKLYSKYTDVLLAMAFRALGMSSNIFTERADAADVEAFGNGFALVADAKAMRLSRTAKNQKDFKVEAMAKWKYGKPFGIVVSPLYQLPSRQSQIYFQSATRDVCLLSYSHLAVLVGLAEKASPEVGEEALLALLTSVSEMNPSKDAQAYWQTINRTLLSQSGLVRELWTKEKLANEAAIVFSKTEALTHLAEERERISRLSHEEAIQQLIVANNIENRVRVITSVQDNGLITLD